VKLEHLKEVLAGYVAAVAVACVVTPISFVILTNRLGMLLILVHPMLFIFFFVYSFGIVSMSALPGWLAFILISERYAINSKLFFCMAGAATSMVAIMIDHFTDINFLGASFKGVELLLACSTTFIGGFCGGLTYWAIAGKHSGASKTTP
jgi:hypothetical protein